MNRPEPEHNSETDDDMLPEYDFSGGVRGKYFRRAIEGTSVVILDDDVAAVFADSESVNRALRLLIEVARKEASAEAFAERKEPYKAD
jgi:hypothetical protein